MPRAPRAYRFARRRALRALCAVASGCSLRRPDRRAARSWRASLGSRWVCRWIDAGAGRSLIGQTSQVRIPVGGTGASRWVLGGRTGSAPGMLPATAGWRRGQPQGVGTVRNLPPPRASDRNALDICRHCKPTRREPLQAWIQAQQRACNRRRRSHRSACAPRAPARAFAATPRCRRVALVVGDRRVRSGSGMQRVAVFIDWQMLTGRHGRRLGCMGVATPSSLVSLHHMVRYYYAD